MRPKDLEPQFSVYSPIHNKLVDGDACNLDVDLVQKMPLQTLANFRVKTSSVNNQEKTYALQLGRYSLPYYKQVLRLISADGKYRMEALEHLPQILIPFLEQQQLPFAHQITPFTKVLSFNLITKVDGHHHPALRAKKFVPWAFHCLDGEKNFQYLLVDFELGSDTYAKFIQDLKSNGGNEIDAMKQAHSHPLYTALGFELVPQVTISATGIKPAVFALYKRLKYV
jgi:hypothetical protein